MLKMFTIGPFTGKVPQPLVQSPTLYEDDFESTEGYIYFFQQMTFLQTLPYALKQLMHKSTVHAAKYEV